MCAVNMVSGLANANPVVYAKKKERGRGRSVDEYAVGPIEIFDILFYHVGSYLINEELNG